MGNSSNSYNCPSCGESISFVNSVNNQVSCTKKHSWRRVGDQLVVSQSRVIDNPSDFIQPGTTGRWNGLLFEVTGRFRLWFKDMACNYWSIDMGDEKIRYLVEGYGLFAVYEPLENSKPVSGTQFKAFWAGKNLKLPGDLQFEITRKNESVYVDTEGTFYTPDSASKIKSVEAVSETGRVDVIAFNEELVATYNVHVATFESLEFQYLREGISGGKAFACKVCESETLVKTYPYAQSWACENCEQRHSILDGLLYRENGKSRPEEPLMDFDIGGQVRLSDVDYTVIGFTHKQDKSSIHETWKEYTLHNREQGYAFLAESQGHWTFLKETLNAPIPSLSKQNSFVFEDREFNRFLSYNFLILYAKGEFPGNIFEDMGLINAVDFISPPEMLSIEKTLDGSKTWFRGEYIDRKLLQVQAPGALPPSVGIAPAQPKFNVDRTTIFMSAIAGIILLLATQVINDMFNNGKKILDTSYVFADSLTSQTFLTEKFTLNKWKSNLELEIKAPVENSWFELNATLINAGTGDEYNLQQGVEYYHGNSGGESWSEGDKTEETYFTSIPKGTYFIQLTGIRDRPVGHNDVKLFQLKLKNDTPMYRNFFILLVFVVGIPFVLMILKYYYESQRWSNSSLSTHSYD